VQKKKRGEEKKRGEKKKGAGKSKKEEEEKKREGLISDTLSIRFKLNLSAPPILNQGTIAKSRGLFFTRGFVKGNLCKTS
jgi:hypothetical protein